MLGEEQMWAVALFPLTLAIISFLFAYNPHWPVHWGGRSGTGPPMSVAGRVMFGVCFTNFSILAAIAATHVREIKAHAPTPPLYGFLFVVGFLFFVVLSLIYLRDKRNSKTKE
jgi:hypothetical protein